MKNDIVTKRMDKDNDVVLWVLGETSKFPFSDHKKPTKDDKRR